MFREMRRKKQLMSIEDAKAVLERGKSGVLAVAGDDDYPYAVPVSYIYYDSKIFFHCAKSGHKLDAIERQSKVSFCVIDKDQIVPEEYTTYFRSVICFGKARVFHDETEKRKAIEKLAEKYSPKQVEGRKTEIEKEFKLFHMVEIEVDHMTGKEAIELVKKQ
ncbi:MAG TPA: pyridoxamine 5'-phosphate oxidase family protein [Bacillota bacterium]|nr:pyridoxamine 5'-phosphate oxidase family protein [Bacillota bacterium]